jgi:hypothetical protein
MLRLYPGTSFHYFSNLQFGAELSFRAKIVEGLPINRPLSSHCGFLTWL